MTETEWLASVDPAAMLRELDEAAWAKCVPDQSRKLRLWACACCRQVWHLLTDERSRRAAEVAERFADGLVSVGERSEAAQDAMDVLDEYQHNVPVDPRTPSEWAAQLAYTCAQRTPSRLALRAALRATGAGVPPPTQAGLLRDIVGNPWRRWLVADWAMNPQAFGFTDLLARRWLTPTVVGIAQAAYDGRDWDRLPVLADALEDAGVPQEVECWLCGGHGWTGKISLSGGRNRTRPCDCRRANNGDRLRPHPLLAHLRGPGPHVRGCWAVDLLLGRE